MTNFLICVETNDYQQRKILTKIINNHPKHKFYLLEYVEKENKELFNQNNVVLLTNNLVDKEYPDVINNLFDRNGRMLNNVKKVIDAQNKLANKIDCILSLNYLDKTDNKKKFYSNRFIKDNTDIPLIIINYLNGFINQGNVYKAPDSIISLKSKLNTNILPRQHTFKLIDNSIKEITEFEYDLDEDIIKTNKPEHVSFDKFVQQIIANPINISRPIRKKVRTVVLEGPKLSGKDTFIREDIVKHNYKEDEYIICHSNPQAKNDYKYFSDQFDLIFDEETRFDYLPKGVKTYKDIDFNKIKAVYHSRNFLSEFIYGSIEFNIMLGLFKTDEYPLGSINIDKLRYARIDVSEVKLLAQKDIELIICYFKHDKYLDYAIELGKLNRSKERLTQYEQEVLKQSNYAFKTMNRLISIKNLNKNFKAISWKKPDKVNKFKSNKSKTNENYKNKFKSVSF